MKMVKTVEKNVFQKIFKTLKYTLPSKTDLYVYIMYFNSSKILKIFGQFRIGARIHIRRWAHS